MLDTMLSITVSVSIKGCYGGDICTLTTGEKIRLAYIDPPELRGMNIDFSKATESRDYLISILKNKSFSQKNHKR